jgi:hypothetical protein
VIRIDVRGTSEYYSDLTALGFRPCAERRLAAVLACVLAIGAGLGSWLGGEKERAGNIASESEDATAQERPPCELPITGESLGMAEENAG